VDKSPQAGPAFTLRYKERGRLPKRGKQSVGQIVHTDKAVVTVVFQQSAHAVAMFQDLNKNGILDTGCSARPRSADLRSPGGYGGARVAMWSARARDLPDDGPSPTANQSFCA